uniref:Clp R domain-containing protein n=1 Tax=Oryza nivara TaxID=4536 RepID=A0A0E0J5R8_ORYNI
MPTPVAAARHCLSPAAVPALDAAVASARRRAHAQTTSLHLISSLLAPPAPPLLRDALARARSAAYSPRVQLKALDLCFAVSLDRLPSVSASSSSSGAADEPPVSNSLMAAIKRSQANQRRNPDTFHFYHQAATAQTPAAVKVELSHLVLAILDDPVVSRVFAEAGFRSGDIKLAILRPAPPMPLLGRLPTRTRPPPLFLCSFAAADDADVPSPAGNLAGAGEENCRRIAEILSRGRNPMLVGKRSPLAAQNSDLSNYKLLVERLFKVVGRQEEAMSAICESIVRCRSTESRRGPSRNDIWLCFHGSDSMAKKRIAVALAELMHGSKDNLIYLDLNLQDWDDSSFRGKTGIDCIVEQLSKKRQSVLFLDNIDRADCLVQDSLSDAIKSGRFQDMRGKVVDINDSIVVLSRSMIHGSKNGLEEGLSFSEEKILATRGHRLKILVEPGRAITSGCPSGKVVVSPRHFLTKIQASLCSGSISKRKLSISDDQEKLQESPSSSKRLHRTSSVPFDLNLPVDEDEPLDADDDSSSHENSYGNTEKSIDALLHSVDGSINFKPFDFDKLADDMLQEFSNILRKNLGSECMLEIDVGAMEQILAAAWKSEEDRKPVPTWLEQVFARSLDELKLKRKHVSSSTLRLVACEDTVPTVKGDGLGVLLPPRIILDC